MRSSYLVRILALAHGLRASPIYPTPMMTTMMELSRRQDSDVPPARPGMEFLYTLNATMGDGIADASNGTAPYGHRTVIPITGGRVHGPKINATIRSLGADWLVQDNHGVAHPDTRYGITTDDGAEIYIRTFGSSQLNGLINLHGLYETGNEKYWWINDIVAVGVLSSGDGPWVKIDMWYITTN